MDPNFVLRHHRQLACLNDCNLRRDPNFSPQLYFMSVEEMGANKFGIYLSQMVAASSASQNGETARAVTFLKRKTSSTLPDPDFRFAIDERAAKLYLSFGNDLIGAETKLRIMDIQFDPADRLGCRRLRVQEQDRLFAVKVTPPVHAFLGGIQICPVRGNIFGQFVVPSTGNTCKSAVALFEEESKAKHSLIRAKLSDHKFTSDNGSRNLDPRTFLFTKLNHLLTLFGFPRSVDRPQTNTCMFLISCDSELNLVRSLAFNPVELVSKFLSADLLWAFFEFRPPFSSKSEAAGSCLDIVGHVHKYVLFSFDGYILAVKWPRDWYTGKNLPPIQLSTVMNLKDLMDDDEDYELINPVGPMTLTEDHLYVVFRLHNKPYEIKRLDLNARFKDYRHCANCGEVEMGKRRNKKGKRIAKYKVCRLCKKRNFHLFYLDPEIACHYCSDECQKIHWKTHKTVHKRDKLDRKTAVVKTVEEKLD